MNCFSFNSRADRRQEGRRRHRFQQELRGRLAVGHLLDCRPQ